MSVFTHRRSSKILVFILSGKSMLLTESLLGGLGRNGLCLTEPFHPIERTPPTIHILRNIKGDLAGKATPRKHQGKRAR